MQGLRATGAEALDEIIVRRAAMGWTESQIAGSLSCSVSLVRDLTRDLRPITLLPAVPAPRPIAKKRSRAMPKPMPMPMLPIGHKVGQAPRAIAIRLIRQIADHNGLDVEALLGSRAYPCKDARDLAVLMFSYMWPEWTLTQIGSLLGGRDHSTMHHSLKKSGRIHPGPFPGRKRHRDQKGER